MTDRITVIGGSWQRARKDHICWGCGGTIAPGEGYFRTFGKSDGKPFAVKHCRPKCEIIGDMLDQHGNDEKLVTSVFEQVLT